MAHCCTEDELIGGLSLPSPPLARGVRCSVLVTHKRRPFIRICTDRGCVFCGIHKHSAVRDLSCRDYYLPPSMLLGGTIPHGLRASLGRPPRLFPDDLHVVPARLDTADRARSISRWAPMSDGQPSALFLQDSCFFSAQHSYGYWKITTRMWKGSASYDRSKPAMDLPSLRKPLRLWIESKRFRVV